MEKLIEMFKKHSFMCILVAFLFFAIVPPLIVHCIYKLPAPCPFFEHTIPAGNMIAYLGTVMTFCATFSLSILVYIQNKRSAERAQLLENKTFISIDTGEQVELCTPSAKQEMSLMFDTEINVLSDTRFSDIVLKYIGIRDDTILGCKRNFSMDFLDKKQVINFQYKNKSKAKISFGIIKVEDYVMDLLQELKRPTIGMDIDFICENVLTPVTITFVLDKDESETDRIKFIYSITEVYVHHHKEKFV